MRCLGREHDVLRETKGVGGIAGQSGVFSATTVLLDK